MNCRPSHRPGRRPGGCAACTRRTRGPTGWVPGRRSVLPDAAGTGPSNTSSPCPGLHDPVDAAARHDDARMPRGVLDLPAPIDLAAVAPHASHILLMGVGPFGLGVSEHPAVGRLGNAQDPALRRYRAAAGVGPYGLCFRANTGAACSETSTSISNWRLRPPQRDQLVPLRRPVVGRPGRTAVADPRTHRCRVEREMSHSVLISRAGLPFSYNCTIRRLNSSS